MPKLIIVTGSNKGIGYQTLKQIAALHPDDNVYLTARNEALGKKAVADATAEGLKVKFHLLDIDNMESITEFAAYVKNTYGGVDIMIHNAAMSFTGSDPTPKAVQASVTTRVNFRGSLVLWNAFSPLLNKGARWVNVSSRVGHLKIVKDAVVRDKLTNQKATYEEIIDVMELFVKAAAAGTSETISNSCYGFSKCGLTALTRVQARQMAARNLDIVVNAVCPGLCKTDMSSGTGYHTDADGAECSVYAAELPPNTPIVGKLLGEKKEVDWEDLNWEWNFPKYDMPGQKK